MCRMEKLKKLKLPEQFCGDCTLKEGTMVVIFLLQVISAVAVLSLLLQLLAFRENTDEWWKRKFTDDYDPYGNGEYKTEIIDKYYPLWYPVTIALAGLEGAYFLTGLGVIYSLWRKDVNPSLYLPWLVYTALLIACNFLTVLGMFIMMCIISAFREITLTWDIVPMMVCCAYACTWSYGFAVVLAHYKRRVIVKYWRDSRVRETQEHWSNNNEKEKHLDF